MDPAADEITDLIRTLAKPSSSHTSTQRSQVPKLCSFLYDSLYAGALQLVADAGVRPTLAYYSCDGTPIRTHLKAKAHVGCLTIRREGKQTQEYLAQVCFLRYADTATRTNSKCIFAPPLPMTEGKSAQAQFQAGLQVSVNLRARGHRGIVLQHYCFDRAIESAMSRMFRQHHLLKAPLYGETKAESKMLANTEWVECAGCALHDAHNSLKWGMQFKQLGPEVLKGVFKVFRALRNSYDLIIEYLPNWLLSTVVWTPEDRCPSPQYQDKLWQILGVDAELARIIAYDLKMHWDFKDKVLRIDESWQKHGKAMEEISGALLGVYHFRPFSDSRWVTIGCNCRTLVASLLLGLPSLVAEIRDDPRSSDYNIGQWDCLGKAELRFITMSSLVSYVSDAACALIFEDQRLARIAAAVKKEIRGELVWLESQPNHMWEAVSLVLHKDDMDAARLKSDVIAGAHISASYFFMKCMTQVAEYPWSLAGGDREKKLQVLKSGPQPTQATGAKIWWLLQAKFSPAQLNAGLDLLLDAPWATAATEQGHAMGALVKRMHHELGQHALVARAMVFGFTKVLPAQTQEEKTVAKLKAELVKLERRAPDKVHAKHMFFKDMMQLASECQRAARHRQAGELARKIMAQHDTLFARLAPWQVVGYEQQAELRRSESRQQVAEQQWSLRDKIRMEQERVEQAKQGRHQLTLTDCKLQPSEVKQLGEDWKNYKVFQRTAATVRMNAFCHAPKVDQKHQAELQQFKVPDRSLMRNPDAVRPNWLAAVVGHRSQFDNTVWAFRGDSTIYLKFLFAMKSPHLISFSTLAPVLVPGPVAAIAAGGGGAAMPARRSEWCLKVGSYVDLSQLPLGATRNIEVYAEAKHIGECRVVTVEEPVTLQAYIEGLPEIIKEPAEKKPKTEGGALNISPAILAKMPWLTADVAKLSRSSGSSKKEAGGEGDAEVDVLDDAYVVAEDCDDEDLDTLFAALELKRREWENHEEGEGVVLAFKISYLKGTWTKENKGRAWDRVKGAGANATAVKWCAQYRMASDTTFTAELYGDSEAAVFAQAWCSRMNYFFGVWLGQSEANYKFTDLDLDGWVPPLGFKAAMDACNKKQVRFLGDRFTKKPTC